MKQPTNNLNLRTHDPDLNLDGKSVLAQAICAVILVGASGALAKAQARVPLPSASNPISESRPISAPAFGVDARPALARIHLSAEFGFGGDYNPKWPSSLGPGSLAPSLGASVAVRFSLGHYFYVGPVLQLTAYQLSRMGVDSGDRSVILGGGAGLGFRYRIDVGAVSIEPTLGVMVGVGVGFASAGTIFDRWDDAPVGPFFGVRGGATLWLTRVLGLHLDLGWHRQHTKSRDGSVFLDQFALGLGVAFRVGG